MSQRTRDLHAGPFGVCSPFLTAKFRADTFLEHLLASPSLPFELEMGELGAAVDAGGLVRVALDDHRLAPLGSGDVDHVGQVIFLRRIVVADLVEPPEQVARAKSHHAAVAQPDRALFLAGVALRRRRFQAALLLLFVVCSSACGGCKGELRTNADRRCFGAECDVDKACTLDADCSGVCPEGNGGICDDGQCICVKACDPGCEDDAFCCLSSSACVPFGDLCADELTCEPGYEPGIGSATPNRETCELEDVTCDCKPLPPIPIGWHGAYASIDSDAGLTVVAAYNKTYGDLMVGRVGADAVIGWITVDGAPADGVPEGDPNGPRRGLTEPAGDVGTHTATVIDGSGRAHVFYRDEDQKALKWSIVTFAEPPTFETVTLDAAGDPGHWTAAAIAGDTIHVLHTALAAAGGSELRHLELDGTGAPATAASAAVVLSEAAVDQGAGFPAYVATFTDLTVTGTTPFAVFYNGLSERVGRMQFVDGAWADPAYVASGTGPYAAGQLGPDGLEHVAFMLPAGLRYSRFGDTATSLVNDGMRLFPDEYWKGAIGADASMRIEGTNHTVAFHDAFDRSLLVATSADGESWGTESFPLEGAGTGFHIAMTRRGEPWVVDMVIDRRMESHAYLRAIKLQ